ncbi:MAG: YraN family protein [Woeseiaceae bacterium]
MKHDKGAQYERQAETYLESRGLKLVARNFRCRFGEVDLIMRHGKCLAFIEVRYRRRNRFSTASGSIDSRKQHRIIRTAAIYLVSHPGYANDPIRFDVVAFDGAGEGRGGIQWLQDAFRA